jgi:hypothetical protein
MSVAPLGNGNIQGRLRWPKHLPKPRKGDVPYAKRRPELFGLLEAEHALAVQSSSAWQEVMVPACVAIDQERAEKRGPTPLYSSEELELALLFGRACGKRSYKETRAVLAGDDPRPRQLLGFDTPRNRRATKQRMRLMDGVPSEATMSRHKARFTEQLRAELWQEVERRLRLEHLETPELQDEAQVMYLDGTTMLTHFTCPARAGMSVGPMSRRGLRKVTCPDGGYVGHKATPEKQGHGWNLVMISSSSGVPLSWRLVPLNSSEVKTALDLVREDFAHEVAPYLHGKVKVLSADGAFTSPEFRAELRQHGVVENIHLASHGDKSKPRAERMTGERYAIAGYDNWFANAHREIVCRCGRGTAKIIDLNKDGGAVVRVQGKCPKCGVISVTSGDWRHTPDNRFVRTHPHDRVDQRDWAFGNPLTFNDLNATEYGKDRFGHNEGLHGALSTRYGLIRNKRWFRRMAQANIDTAMTFALIHAVSLEQRRRVRQAAAPPGAAAAA